MKKNKLTSIIAFIFCFYAVKGQNNKPGNWFIYFGNQKINEKFNFHNEIQYRNYNFIGDISQLLIRTGIGYNLNKNNNILLGYGFIETFTNEASTSNKKKIVENRIYQQYSNKHPINNYFITHRIRFEERFIEKTLEYRIRYFISLNKPLNKSKMEKNAIYLSSYNEIFVKPTNQFFDRDRIYGGLGFLLNNNVKIETGYMIQATKDKRQQQFQIILFNNSPFKN